jgi:hypothetical protein
MMLDYCGEFPRYDIVTLNEDIERRDVAMAKDLLVALLLDTVQETQIHAWDGWRQVTQHKLEPVAGVWQATSSRSPSTGCVT